MDDRPDGRGYFALGRASVGHSRLAERLSEAAQGREPVGSTRPADQQKPKTHRGQNLLQNGKALEIRQALRRQTREGQTIGGVLRVPKLNFNGATIQSDGADSSMPSESAFKSAKTGKGPVPGVHLAPLGS